MSCYGHPDESHWSKYEDTCSECGKTHLYNKHYIYWFDTMDGGDNYDTVVCLKCEIRNWIFRKVYKPIHLRMQLHKETREWKRIFMKNVPHPTKEQRGYWKEFLQYERDRRLKNANYN